jgi:hypothetical protein
MLCIVIVILALLIMSPSLMPHEEQSELVPPYVK